MMRVYPSALGRTLNPVSINRMKYGTATFCVPCGDNSYSLSPASTSAASYTVGSGSDWCLPCPYGVNCTNLQPRSLRLFWGYRNVTASSASQTVLASFFVLPPSGYGCFPECDSYHSCNGNRHGPLCGQCLPGYSRSLLSTSCVEDRECNSATSAAFVFLSVLFIFVYCVYLIAPRPIDGATNRESYFQLLMFFYQFSLAITQIRQGLDSLTATALQLISIIFNASPTDGKTPALLCFIPSIGEGTIIVAQAVIFIVFVAVMLALSVPWGWLLFQKVFYASISFLVHAGIPLPYDKKSLPPPPTCLCGRWLLPAADRGAYNFEREDVSGGLDQRGAAWMRLYITLYSGVFSLLVKTVTCVTIEGIEGTPELDRRWYYDASVVCFAPWQKGCIVALLFALMLPIAVGLRMQFVTSERRTAPLNSFEQSAVLYYMRPFKPHCKHWVRGLRAVLCTCASLACR